MKNVAAVSGSRGKTSQQPDHESFETFLEGWLVRQEHLLDELMSVERRTCNETNDDEHLHDLVTRVLAHYQQYYEHKSIAARKDVFRLFAPSYFSSLEQSFLWIAGFKPGLALKLACSVVEDLNEEQKLRLKRLIDETRVDERGLTDDLARIQESVAAPPTLEVLRSVGMSSDSSEVVVVEEEEEAMERVRAGLERVVGNADSLRTSTAAKVAEILSPVQNVRFFKAVAQLQVNVRFWGNQRDAEQRWNVDGRW